MILPFLFLLIFTANQGEVQIRVNQELVYGKDIKIDSPQDTVSVSYLPYWHREQWSVSAECLVRRGLGGPRVVLRSTKPTFCFTMNKLKLKRGELLSVNVSIYVKGEKVRKEYYHLTLK